jgi:hypothetical protein
MERPSLNLHFLDQPTAGQPNEASILEDYGKLIEQYASGYHLRTVVTTTNADGQFLDCSLYVVVPEIEYDYKVLTVERTSVTNGRILFFTLRTSQVEQFKVDFSQGFEDYQAKLREILNSGLFNISLRFLIDQVELKRRSRSGL